MKLVSNLKLAAQGLCNGKLVAFPTETVYGLGADAENAESLNRLFETKGRPKSHPVIIHIGNLSKIHFWVKDIPNYANDLARAFWPGPMTLLLHRRDHVLNLVTGGQSVVGVRYPSHEITQQLLEEFHKIGGNGVAAPSANRFGKVSPTSASAVIDELSGYIRADDMLIDGGRSGIGIESTILDCTGKLPRILRPGAITKEMLSEICMVNESASQDALKAPGTLSKHYSPRADVVLNQTPNPGDGLVALSTVLTPAGVIRLSSPNTIEEFAQDLYSAFRIGDKLGLQKIHVLIPSKKGLAIAIADRVKRAASQE